MCKREFGGGRVYSAACFVIVLLILFDQWTKQLVLVHLRGAEPVVLINGVLELLYTENRGAAFGILEGRQWFFFLIAGAVCLAVCLAMRRLPKTRRYLPLFADFCFLVSGALGNVIDRVRHAFVVDFIYFKPIDFPVFNVADIYITCACAGLVLLLLFYYKDDELSIL